MTKQKFIQSQSVGFYLALCLALLFAAWPAASVTVAQQTPEQNAPDEMAEPLRYQGLVMPDQHVQLGVPREGILKSLMVKEGDHVKAGQLLLVIDDREQAARVHVARLKTELTAELKRAGLAVEEAKINMEMVKRANDQDAASDWEVRRARLQYEQQLATVEALEEEMKVASAMLEYEQAGLEQFSLKAPFEGEIVDVMTEQGATLHREDEVLTLVSIAKLRAELRLPMVWYGKLKRGETYQLQLGDPVNKRVMGKLIFIDPRIDPASRTFRCVFSIENQDGSIPAGVVARLAENKPK